MARLMKGKRGSNDRRENSEDALSVKNRLGSKVGHQAAPGSASEIVIALTEHISMGELDGQPAAAVILYSSGGGSGTFYELHVMVDRDEQPYDIAWTQLGDRVQINTLAVEGDEIVVDMVTHGPDDPMCCPTQQVVQTYALQGEELTRTSE